MLPDRIFKQFNLGSKHQNAVCVFGNSKPRLNWVSNVDILRLLDLTLLAFLKTLRSISHIGLIISAISNCTPKPICLLVQLSSCHLGSVIVKYIQEFLVDLAKSNRATPKTCYSFTNIWIQVESFSVSENRFSNIVIILSIPRSLSMSTNLI